MKKKPLFWQLYPSLLVISVGSVVLVAVLAVIAFRSFWLEKVEEDLVFRVDTLAGEIRTFGSLKNISQVKTLLDSGKKNSSYEILVLNSSGEVIAGNPIWENARGENLVSSDFKGALSDGAGRSVRVSLRKGKDFGEKVLFYSRSVDSGEHWILRGSVPLELVKKNLNIVYLEILAVIGGVIFLISIVGHLLARRISQPLTLLQKHTERIMQGDFSGRIFLESRDPAELHDLSEGVNALTKEIDHRLRTMKEQKDERDAVFASMREGVLAFDQKRTLRDLNDSAAEMLGLTRSRALGLSLEEVIRISELREFIDEGLQNQGASEREIRIFHPHEVDLHVRSSPLQDIAGLKKGVVIVLNDLTHLKRLETYRKDFVANVSHELKTPLTAIQGFAETLLSGGVSDQKQQNHFLGIIQKQASRLSRVIEDLLTLSSLEKGNQTVEKETQKIKPVLKAALESCSWKTLQEKIEISLECSETLEAQFNSSLLEQAVLNLLENALKYGSDGKKVELRAVLDAEGGKNEVKISVKDYGPGIAKEHLDRVFERFYRIEKSRSRQAGGTGLGLSIVKHIALLHGGRVHVESQVGAGCEFSLWLPSS